MKKRNTDKELEIIENKTKFKHFQHTKSFNKELNTPNQNITTPFRLLDNVWLIGKYKGYKLENIPVNYLSWVLENFNHISSSHKALIQVQINKS